MSELSRLYGDYSFTTRKQAQGNNVKDGHFKLYSSRMS